MKSKSVNCTKRQFTGYSTKEEAWKAVDDLRSGLEGVRRVVSNPSAVTLRSRVNISTTNAFKRVKKMMGWKKLTMDQWLNHTDLLKYSLYEDLVKGMSRRTILRLDNVFGSPLETIHNVFRSPDRSAMDCIRYLNAKAEFLMKRASEYKEEASILFACNDIRYVHKLLLIERIVDNDCIENVSFKKSKVKRPIHSHVPDDAISDVQRERVKTQILAVSQLYYKFSQKDEAMSKLFQDKIQLINNEPGARGTQGQKGVWNFLNNYEGQKAKQKSSEQSWAYQNSASCRSWIHWKTERAAANTF